MTGGTLPTILVVGLLASGAAVLWQTLVALLGIFLAVMALAIYTMARAGAGAAVEMGQSLASLRTDPDTRPDLVPESLDWMRAPALSPVTIAVLKAAGVCPLGYKPGQTWVIDGVGHISRPLCRPAVTALGRMFASDAWDEVGQEAPCICPFTDRQVIFEVGPEIRTGS